MSIREELRIHSWAIRFLPDYIRHEVHAPENFIAEHLEVVALIVIYGDPERPVCRQELADDLKSVAHQRQPDGVLHPIVIMGEGAAGVIGRIDEDTFHLTGVLLFQRLQRQQVIPKDQLVVEDVTVSDPLSSMVRLLGIPKKDARLQPRPVLLPDPRKFKLLMLQLSIPLICSGDEGSRPPP